MPAESRSPVLAGHRALVIGIANEHSIAYGCAKAFRELGAVRGLSADEPAADRR